MASTAQLTQKKKALSSTARICLQINIKKGRTEEEERGYQTE